MKTQKPIIYSVLIPLFFIQAFLFSGCNPDGEKGKNRLVYKPNIYIYPEENIQLKVTVDFPLGGEIVNSIPSYNEVWKISVDTSGMINDEYTYLFYESRQPDIWQNKEGWTVEAGELKLFFRENMKAYGFEGGEIEDFIEYWIPKLNVYKYYSIYPQTIDLIEDVIRLNFSKEPDFFLRLFYLVEGSDIIQDSITEPEIKTFTRKGYFVTEWGVIL